MSASNPTHGDFTAKKNVEIVIGETGLVTWICVDNICIARLLTNDKPIVITDNRPKKVKK